MIAIIRWAHKHLFSSIANTILTLLIATCLFYSIPPLLNWLFIDATWHGTTHAACAVNEGACWVFVKMRLKQFLVGFYPDASLWRIALGIALFILAFVLYALHVLNKMMLAVWLVLIYPWVAVFLFYGGWFAMPVIETSRWGGLFLTLVLATFGIILAFPIGVLLALGRRSSMPIIKALCVGFIELVRGVPLISILFMASVMFPLFVPQELHFDKLLRAQIGIILFQGAYLAEVVRGGLQAIGKGQYEAARSLGLSTIQRTRLIILPQALRLVIPGIVNTQIALFKDTSLVLIIGLFDFLGIVQSAATDPAWLGTTLEGYVFCAFVYWVFCFSMSRYSYRIEKRLSTGR